MSDFGFHKSRKSGGGPRQGGMYNEPSSGGGGGAAMNGGGGGQAVGYRRGGNMNMNMNMNNGGGGPGGHRAQFNGAYRGRGQFPAAVEDDPKPLNRAQEQAKMQQQRQRAMNNPMAAANRQAAMLRRQGYGPDNNNNNNQQQQNVGGGGYPQNQMQQQQNGVNNNNNQQQQQQDTVSQKGMSLLERIKASKEEAKNATETLKNVKAQANAAENNIIQGELNTLARRVDEQDKVIEELTESVTDLFSQVTEISQGELQGGNFSSRAAQRQQQGGANSSSSRDPPEVTKKDFEDLADMVLAQEKIIDELKEALESRASSSDSASRKTVAEEQDDSVTSSSVAATTTTLNKDVKKEIAHEIQKMSATLRKRMRDTEQKWEIEMGEDKKKFEAIDARIQTMQNQLFEVRKNNKQVQEDVAENINTIFHQTWWYYGQALYDSAMYESMPEIESSLVPTHKFAAGDWIFMTLPMEDNDTGTWIKARMVDENGEMSHGYVALQSSMRYILGDTNADESDTVQAIDNFTLHPTPEIDLNAMLAEAEQQQQESGVGEEEEEDVAVDGKDNNEGEEEEEGEEKAEQQNKDDE